MKLKILTPQRLVLEKDIESVTMPGAIGQLTVMDGHDISITEIVPGRLYFRYLDAEGKPSREDYGIGPGLAEVTHDVARVFVATAQRSS